MSGEGGYAHLPSPLGNNKGVSFVVILKKVISYDDDVYRLYVDRNGVYHNWAGPVEVGG